MFGRNEIIGTEINPRFRIVDNTGAFTETSNHSLYGALNDNFRDSRHPYIGDMNLALMSTDILTRENLGTMEWFSDPKNQTYVMEEVTWIMMILNHFNVRRTFKEVHEDYMKLWRRIMSHPVIEKIKANSDDELSNFSLDFYAEADFVDIAIQGNMFDRWPEIPEKVELKYLKCPAPDVDKDKPTTTSYSVILFPRGQSNGPTICRANLTDAIEVARAFGYGSIVYLCRHYWGKGGWEFYAEVLEHQPAAPYLKTGELLDYMSYAHYFTGKCLSDKAKRLVTPFEDIDIDEGMK